MDVEINIEQLRRDLIDYFGTASQFFPVAIVDISRVENASPEELINIAISNGFDINDYIVKGYSL